MPPPYAPGHQGFRQIYKPDGITPYLGLRARLSQVWINRWTVLLLLVLVRVLLAIQGLKSDMASAKVEALSACTSVESMGSAMASMPHYMAAGVNEIMADGFTKAVQALIVILQLTVTGVEEIVIFFINFMTQTYLCLITVAVKGSVEAAVTILEDVTGFLNKELPSIGQDINQTANTLQNAINDFISKINGVVSVFSGNKNPPTIDLSKQVDELNNFQLPSSINTTLDKINSSVPTFDQVKNFTESVISIPFEALKHDIDLHLGDYQFDKSVFPVPGKEQLAFCQGNDAINGFFDGVDDLINMARKIFIAVLVIAAILACVPMAYREIWRWRSMKERSLLVQKHVHEPMDVVYIISRPYTSTAGIKVASMFRTNNRRQILTRWAIAYATSTPALFVLSLALAGLFSCLCHYILLRSVEKVVPELTAEVTSFADKVVDKLNNASEQWAIGVNQVIDATNRDINGNLFSWVNVSTGAINDTLNTFISKTTDLLNETFGGTILYQPILGLFDCLIGLKVQGIENGLTWVSDHAHINIPNTANNTFSIGAAASLVSNGSDSDSFLTDPGAVTSDKISEVVVSVVNKIQDSIRKETLISAGILLVWVFVALMGIVRALILGCIREKHRGEGGPEPVINDPNDGFADATYFHPDAKSGPPQFDPAAEDVYQMQNLGFAGQRDLRPEPASSAAVRQSSYVQYGGDEKRGF